MVYKMIIYFLIYFHVIFWIYVIFGSLCGKIHAKFILCILIPLTYLIHCLPFHIINYAKKKTLKTNTDDELDDIIKCYEHKLPLIKNIMYLKKYIDNLFNKSFASPLSAQGMLILGYIISICSLFNFNYKNVINL